MTDIGYKHGEITFAAPFHVPFGAIAHIDHPFANALSTLTKEHVAAARSCLSRWRLLWQRASAKFLSDKRRSGKLSGFLNAARLLVW